MNNYKCPFCGLYLKSSYRKGHMVCLGGSKFSKMNHTVGVISNDTSNFLKYIFRFSEKKNSFLENELVINVSANKCFLKQYKMDSIYIDFQSDFPSSMEEFIILKNRIIKLNLLK